MKRRATDVAEGIVEPPMWQNQTSRGGCDNPKRLTPKQGSVLPPMWLKRPAKSAQRTPEEWGIALPPMWLRQSAVTAPGPTQN